MKKLLLKTLLYITSLTALWALITIIVFALVETPVTSYNAAAIDKLNRLKQINEPKIVLVGGSNLAFGIDSALIEAQTGRPVVNLGLHAGMGFKFYTEMAKKNLNPGDVVVLSLEYDLLDGSFDPESILHTLEIDPSLINNLDQSLWGKTLAALPEYTFNRAVNTLLGKKTTYTGIYSRASFNVYGDIAVARPKNIMTNAAHDVLLTLEPAMIAESTLAYLKQFKADVQAKGATVVLTFPCLNETNLDPASDVNGFVSKLSEDSGIQAISLIQNYLLPDELFFDTHYHLNDQGVILRSTQLAQDISEYLSR